MQTVTVQINDDNALKTIEALVDKQFITIIDSTDIDSPALPGKPLGITAFKNWINEAEQTPSISKTEAISKWAGKRKLLQKLTK